LYAAGEAQFFQSHGETAVWPDKLCLPLVFGKMWQEAAMDISDFLIDIIDILIMLI
jgi:hypothetical protein